MSDDNSKILVVSLSVCYWYSGTNRRWWKPYGICDEVLEVVEVVESTLEEVVPYSRSGYCCAAGNLCRSPMTLFLGDKMLGALLSLLLFVLLLF